VRQYAGYGFAFSTIFPMKPSPRDLLIYMPKNTDITHQERKK